MGNQTIRLWFVILLLFCALCGVGFYAGYKIYFSAAVECDKELPKVEFVNFFKKNENCPDLKQRAIQEWFPQLDDKTRTIDLSPYRKLIEKDTDFKTAVANISNKKGVIFMKGDNHVERVYDVKDFADTRVSLKTYECEFAFSGKNKNASKINLGCNAKTKILSDAFSKCSAGRLSPYQISLLSNTKEARDFIFDNCTRMHFRRDNSIFQKSSSIQDWNNVFLEDPVTFCDQFDGRQYTLPALKFSVCNFTLEKQEKIIEHVFNFTQNGTSLLDFVKTNEYLDSDKRELLVKFNYSRIVYSKIRKDLFDNQQFISWVEIDGKKYEEISSKNETGAKVEPSKWHQAIVKFYDTKCLHILSQLSEKNAKKTLQEAKTKNCSDPHHYIKNFKEKMFPEIKNLEEYSEHLLKRGDLIRDKIGLDQLDLRVSEYNYKKLGSILGFQSGEKYIASATNHSSGSLTLTNVTKKVHAYSDIIFYFFNRENDATLTESSEKLNNPILCRFIEASLNWIDYNQFTFIENNYTFTPSECKFKEDKITFRRYVLEENGKNLEKIRTNINWTPKRKEYWTKKYKSMEKENTDVFYYIHNCDHPVEMGFDCKDPFVKSISFVQFYENQYTYMKSFPSQNDVDKSFSKSVMIRFLERFNTANVSLSKVVARKNEWQWFLGRLNGYGSWYSYFDAFVLQIAQSLEISTTENGFFVAKGYSRADKNMISLIEHIANVNFDNEDFFYLCSWLKRCKTQHYKYAHPDCFYTEWYHKKK